MSNALTREQLLALRPEDLVPAVLRGGLDSEHWGTASLVFAYHLKLAAVPFEAIDLCLVGTAAAAEEPLVAARERMERVVAIQTAGIPSLERWMRLLADEASDPARLATAVRFLEHVRRTWLALEIGELA